MAGGSGRRGEGVGNAHGGRAWRRWRHCGGGGGAKATAKGAMRNELHVRFGVGAETRGIAVAPHRLSWLSAMSAKDSAASTQASGARRARGGGAKRSSLSRCSSARPSSARSSKKNGITPPLPPSPSPSPCLSLSPASSPARARSPRGAARSTATGRAATRLARAARCVRRQRRRPTAAEGKADRGGGSGGVVAFVCPPADRLNAHRVGRRSSAAAQAPTCNSSERRRGGGEWQAACAGKERVVGHVRELLRDERGHGARVAGARSGRLGGVKAGEAGRGRACHGADACQGRRRGGRGGSARPVRARVCE
ncbi:hypothetical protein FGB62_20g05 [Gracilaria domingensis]|nr:hypothetical protein FGB62_20g05 [Gracilaria domingensis]